MTIAWQCRCPVCIGLGAWVVVAFRCAASGRAQTSSPSRRHLRRSVYETGERALGERRYADAERAYEQLRQQQSRPAEVHARLGLVYFQQGKFAAAVPALRRALELKPALPNLDALLAMSLSELGRYKEALPALVGCSTIEGPRAEAHGRPASAALLYRARQGQEAVDVALG